MKLKYDNKKKSENNEAAIWIAKINFVQNACFFQSKCL